ncbi:MAG TPA: LacI family transcriptional regulator, partial [Alphaproteobacteria bacterium]|nr:LacI family transcriptional regulator [Alphaproteobacteria bacterium]
MTDERGERSERRGRGAPTIRDVARLADVSIGTASKALNANGRLRQETRDKVMRVAREIGYRPNDLAQSLHRARSMTVGIISNDSFGRFTLPIVEALEEQLADRGIAIFMCNATDDPARERQHLDQLLGKRIDGLVVTARRADKRAPIGPVPPGLPVLYVYSQADDHTALSLVPDDEGGARLAVTHLASLGRRRIAHVTGPERFDAVRLRYRGYLGALSQAGLVPPPDGYLAGAWSEEWGREAVSLLFAGPARPDAVFCGNDQIARGVAEALRDRG